MAHQVVKGGSLVGNLGLAENPGDDIVFNGDTFDLGEALRLGIVPANDFFGLFVALGGLFDQGADLFGSGLQLFALDHFGQDQTELDATAGLVGKPLRLHREILGLHAALFHILASCLHQALHFQFGQRVRDGDRVGGEQGFHHLFLDLAFDPALDFALQVAFDFCAHLADVAIGNAHHLSEVGIDFRQAGGLNLLDGNFELHGLAGQILGEVIGRESHVEGLAFAGLETFNCLLEIGEHHALTENEGVVAGLAALEGLAVLLAEEVDDDAVFLLGAAVGGVVTDALLAQDFQGVVDFGCADFQGWTLDAGSRQVAQGDLRVNLENRSKFEVRGAVGGLRLNSRIAGHAQFLFGHRGAENAVQFFGQYFVTGLVAILLLDDVERNLARAEARHFDIFAHALEALFHFLFDIGDGDGKINAAFEFVGLCGGCFHEFEFLVTMEPRIKRGILARKVAPPSAARSSQSCCFRVAFIGHANINIQANDNGQFAGMHNQEQLVDRRLQARGKAQVYTGALVLLAFVVLLLSDLYFSRERELAHAERELQSIGLMLERHLLDTVERIDVALVAVADDYPQLLRLPANEANRQLAVWLQRIPDSQSLRIADAKGRFIYDASGILPAVSVADRPYRLRLKNDSAAGLVLSEPIHARVTNNWVITLSRRLVGERPGFVGHVQAAINAQQFGALFRRVVGEDLDFVAVLDKEMRLVAVRDGYEAQLGQSFEVPALSAFLASGEIQGGRTTALPGDTVERRFVFRKVGDLPLVIVLGRASADVLAQWRIKAAVYGVCLLVLLAALLALLRVWSKSYRLAWRLAAEMEAAYNASEQRARTLLDSIPDPAWLRDCNGRFLAVNEAYLSLCGKRRDEVVGQLLEEVWSPRRAAAFRYQDYEVVVAGGRVEIAGKLRHADGGDRYYEYIRSPLRDARGEVAGVAGFARDVTARKAAEERARYLAEFDALTGLPNLSQLPGHLVRLLASRPTAQPALFCLDLDHFKNINDSLGHSVGDRVLQAVAIRVREILATGDLAVRQGGDELVILVAERGGVSALAQLAQQLLEAVAQPIQVEGRELRVSMSIGIALCPLDGRDIETLLKNADAALHGAKSAGRNAYRFFEPEMNARAADRVDLDARLRKAFEAEALCLHYQPQYHLASGRLVGVEALLRWPDPVEGWISPVRFIPLAEETGLIRQIGAWVLREACRQAVCWGFAEKSLVMAVNLSAVQLSSPGVVELLATVLHETGLAPACLELEITESMLMNDAEAAVETLMAFRQMGVKLAIDDFGTGYSSLAYLKRLPLDKIKIDRSFVSELTEEGGRDAAIVQAIIAVARKLGLKVIAEGVEQGRQAEFLVEFGCDEGQGYYYARPLGVEQLTSLLPVSSEFSLRDEGGPQQIRKSEKNTGQACEASL